jgi:hypothetical protein
LTVEDDLTIVGPGADLLTLDLEGGSFFVTDVAATFKDLTIQGGIVGEIDKEDGANITLDGVTIDGGAEHGIWMEFSTLNMSNSTIDNAGDGVNAFNSNVSIYGSTISNNSAGGILYYSTSEEYSLSIVNSTISGNSGGGVKIQSAGSSSIVNCTITNNTSDSSEAAGLSASGSVTVTNTIIAGNHMSDDSDSDVFGDFGTSGHNLIGFDPNDLFGAGDGNIRGTTSAIDAGLAPLAYYGGKTKTHALLSSSMAVDAGDNDFVSAGEHVFDQRGKYYDRIVDWDLDDDFVVDIGSFELAIGELYT